MMDNLPKGRRFQLWELSSGHSGLLIRSPKGAGRLPSDPIVETNIDLLCLGVEYIELIWYLGELQIVPMRQDEVGRISRFLGEAPPIKRLLALENEKGQRFLLVAAAWKIEEHACDIFESPFRDKSGRLRDRYGLAE
jgi:hypothetical protein